MEYKNAHNEDDFQDYFEKYKDMCIDKKIVDENLWNIDKTRFYPDYLKIYWVIILDPDKPMILTDLDN